MPISLYGNQLWYFKGAFLFHFLKELKKMQYKAVLWITGTFYTFLTWRVETIAVKIVDKGLYFIFPFHFYFILLYFFLFNFLFLEQLGLGFISHTVTSVTN